MRNVLTTHKFQIIIASGFGLLGLVFLQIWLNSRPRDLRTPSQLGDLARKLAGPHAIDCGRSLSTGDIIRDEKQFFKVHACAAKAFEKGNNFYIFFEHEEFGFIQSLFKTVDYDYVIYSPDGRVKLIRWKQSDEKITQTPVAWSLREVDNAYVGTWGYPGNEPIFRYSGDRD
jgi:hypothetical protein